MRDFVLLYVNGRRHEVRGAQVFRPLSDFFRDELRLTGSKVVCAEGDCGACTVLIGRPSAGRIEYRPVTSCIQYIAQLDAAHVVTVEGLQHGKQINPVQQSLVTHHGAQCGYCTPGIVVALCALFDQIPCPSRQEATRALVGNLCRCTGYDSILEAVAHVDHTQWRETSDLYPDHELIHDLERFAAESVEIVADGRILLKPATFDEAVCLRNSRPDATVLAGGTDLGVQWNKRGREFSTLLHIGGLSELTDYSVRDRTWILGAGTTITQLEQQAKSILPAYARMLERFGSPPIKNVATLGGNLANGSPIGDSMPALLVLEAEVELISVAGSRRVNLNQFYTGYRRNVLAANELVRRVIVPLPADNQLFATYKISKRRDLDISTFTAAVWMDVVGDVIRAARIAFGGVAPTIVRLPRTEAWLSERRFTETTLRQAGALAKEEIAPISDVRGSAQYRSLLAENILVKFGREVLEAPVPSRNGN
jgi:xanthine dehydrogenase small subunit